MLRPLGTEAMTSLRAAASMGDVALDLALMRCGVLPPADLDEIRSLLRHPSAQLRPATNRDGHVIIEVFAGEHQLGQVHHDGRVLALAS